MSADGCACAPPAACSVDEALQRCVAGVQPLPSEWIARDAGLLRVLAAPAFSAHPLPLFTQSAVDGYAVRHADIAGAPCALPLGAHIAATPQASHPQLAPGTAARILTGGLLPLGADTVVRQELTQRCDMEVQILSAVIAGSDIRHAGEEIAAGALLAEVGQRLTPGLIGALAMAGVEQVSVRRPPRIVVLISGDELQRERGPLQLGQIPDANGPLLRAWLQHWGLAPSRCAYLPDQSAAVRAALDAALADSDLVITSGGVSVGDHDYIPDAAEAVGAQCLLWKVAQKPGMPLYVARRGSALLFGLPGNPASVLTNLLVYVRSALDAMQGLDPERRWRRGRLLRPVRRDTHKTLWLRAALEYDAAGAVLLRPLQGQGSHMLGNLREAGALVELPPQGGERVRWLEL